MQVGLIASTTSGSVFMRSFQVTTIVVTFIRQGKTAEEQPWSYKTQFCYALKTDLL